MGQESIPSHESWIRDSRKRVRWTQEDLGNCLGGVSQATVSPLLRITGPERGVAARGETATTAAEVVLRGVTPGTYDDGKVVTRCPECPPKCRLDYWLSYREEALLLPTGNAI